MPRIAEADRLEFAARARSLFISGATVEWFLESATPGQLEACSSMLARELESRERSKRARLLRQARFPVHKTLEGFDWSNVGFPDDTVNVFFTNRANESAPSAQTHFHQSRKRAFAASG